MGCRICNGSTRAVLDLGAMPLANRLCGDSAANEPRFPLTLEHCARCGNLQLSHCVPADQLYDDYLYITPRSQTLEQHYRNALNFMQGRGYLRRDASLFEFGSNIGRFLEWAKPRVGRVLGLDPARAICEQATELGIPTICAYFGPDAGAEIARAHGRFDVVAARHCAAHNADAHALIAGVRRCLADDGVFMMENAYGLTTVVNQELGQIYHEHMYYFTARAVQELFAAHGLELIDLYYTPEVQSGSMLFFGAPAGTRPVRPAVGYTIARERALLTDAVLDLLPRAVDRWRDETQELLRLLRGRDRTVWLYGASAKAATYIGAAGIDAPAVVACADSTPEKQGKYLPGTSIPIRSEGEAITARPDYFLITAWNFRDEIIRKVRAAGNDHSGFAVPFPEVFVVEDCAMDRIS